MKLRKIIAMLIITFTIMASTCAVLNTESSAANSGYWLGITNVREAVNGQGTGGAYGIGGTKGNNMPNKKVWKIVSYADGQSDIPNYDNAFYCIEAEYGFVSNSSDTVAPKKNYNVQLDMKNNKTEVMERLNTINTSKSDDTLTEQVYNKIMWILDNLYLPKTSGAEYKQALLEKAGITDNYSEVLLTDDDIEVIQQLAIWYYTNPKDTNYHEDEQDDQKMRPKLGTLYFNKNSGQDSNYQSFADLYDSSLLDTNDGAMRQSQAQDLYRYFIENAKEDYVPTLTSAPVTVTKGAVATQDGNRFIIGPFKVEAQTDRINGNLEIKVLDQAGREILLIGNNKLLNENKQEVTSGNLNEVIGQNFYISLPVDTETTSVKLSVKASYDKRTATYYTTEQNTAAGEQPVVLVEKVTEEFNDFVEASIPEAEYLDLALRKSITKIDDTAYDRLPKVQLDELKNESDTTATYNHPKNDLEVQTGSIIEYTITVYNEGDKKAYAAEIKDYLPAGIEFVELVSPKDKYSVTSTKNADGTETLLITNTGKTVLDEYAGGESLDSESFIIKCKVTAEAGSTDKRLVNIAEITKYYDYEDDKLKAADRDSEIENFPSNKKNNDYNGNGVEGNFIPGQQDDDDFELVKLKGKEFDLALRKFISKINGEELEVSREPKVDVTPLTQGQDTAIYEHPKTAVSVKVGDIVTYTIRVYNEGELDGYASEVTDHLPPHLEFLPDDEDNIANGWVYDEDDTTLRTIKTTHLSKEIDEDNIIKAFDGKKLDYKDLEVKCKVKDTAASGEKVTNIADITNFEDKNGDKVDRDSQEHNVIVPPDEELPKYKDEEVEKGDKFIPGQQDDDDFEKVTVQVFDLALRKFITKVDDLSVNNRYPKPTLNENGNIKYEHTKEPVDVENGNIVTYTIRVYNEGNIAGYAKEVTDDLPEGLEYLPENSVNKLYRWKMIDKDGKVTEKLEEAVKVTTDYLSKEQEAEEGENLLKAFDFGAGITDTNPDYRDVQIAFKVTEPNTSDRILTNTAQVSDDSDEFGNPIEDQDSTPGNNVPEEDDQDTEKVKVRYFDLSLKKWVTKAIVIDNGKQTITETGHTGDENPEVPVKVDIKASKLKKVTVKFEFAIKVTNEGQIEGYAKELKEHIPQGLKFVKEDNPDWTQNEDGSVTTTKLENTLLKPGESATVTITLTWINGNDNLGLKTNVAEISKDENDSNTPDIDSTPDNNKPEEDDQDDAPVILGVRTGNEKIYFTLTGIILVTIAGGIFLIKKYVL